MSMVFILFILKCLNFFIFMVIYFFMLLSIVSSFFLVFGISLADFILGKFFSFSVSIFFNFIEFCIIIFLISFFSANILIVDNPLIVVFLSFIVGFFCSVLVKLVFLFYFKHNNKELFLFEKSNVIQLVRSMCLEGVSKCRIRKILRRVGVDDSLIGFF